MLNSTQEYREAIEASSRVILAEFMLNGTIYRNSVLTKMEYDSSISGGNQFVVGGAFINSLSVEIKEVVEDLQEMMPATARLGVELESSLLRLPLGKFFITEVKLDRNAKTTKIKLEDEFVRLLDNYQSELSYPSTSRKILQEIVTKTGIKTAKNITLIDDVISNKLEKVTYRDVLMYLAQLNGTFVRFNRYGELDFIQLKPTQKHVTKDHYGATGLVREEVKYRLGSINCKVEHGDKKQMLTSGNQSGNKMEFNNPFMTQQILDRLYNQYRTFNFYPYSLDWRGDIAVEAGDWISVHWGDNERFDVPVLSHKLVFDGGLSAKSGANETGAARSQYKYRSPLQEKIDYLEALASSSSVIYMNDAEPHNPKENDKWFKPSGGYVKLLEYINGKWVEKADTADLDKIVKTISTDEVIAKKISAAVAQIIEINANKIVAGDIDLNRIRIMQGSKEVLTVRDGKVVIDVSNANDVSEALSTLSSELSKKADKQETHTAIEAVAQVSKKTADSFKTNKEITDAQYKVLTSQLALAKQELEAKASLETIRDWQASYNAFVKAEGEHKAEAERNLVALSNRMVGIQNNLGNMTETWNSVRANMTFGEEGLTIGAAGSTTNIFITNERISMMSSGNEVMYISQGVIHIDNGVFTKTLQVGHYIESQYSVNPKYNVIRYVEKI